MDNYVTGAVIRRLREDKKMTQAELAARLDVSPKTISKWETAKGLPDISLLDPLAAALEVSVMELMTGDKFRMVKLYPEGNAECRFRFRGLGYLYIYCNRHGLMRIKVK